jgi:hypothetical protein
VLFQIDLNGYLAALLVGYELDFRSCAVSPGSYGSCSQSNSAACVRQSNGDAPYRVELVAGTSGCRYDCTVFTPAASAALANALSSEAMGSL